MSEKLIPDEQINDSVGKKAEKLNINPEILKEQKTILYLSYLTTLARLPENRDLDELFDGDIQLGEEEMFAIYGLIEILNGHNSIDKLPLPKKINSDGYQWFKSGPDVQQDYDYNLEYKKVVGKNVIDKITGDGFLPLNETTIEFNYGKTGVINSMNFDRPRTVGALGVGVNPNHNLSFKRDNHGKVTFIEVHRGIDGFNNDLVISYGKNGKVEKVEQSKISPKSDTILYEYEGEDLKNIIYTPTFSIKHIAKVNKIAKGGKNAVESAKRIADFAAMSILKKMKKSDVIQVENINGLPVSSKAILHDSRWFWNEGFSNLKYGTKGEIKSIYREMEEIGFDDKRKLNIEY